MQSESCLSDLNVHMYTYLGRDIKLHLVDTGAVRIRGREKKKKKK